MLPLPKALFLDLSFNLCKGCEGIAAPVGELCCTLCALVCGFVPHNFCISRYPPDVDLGVVSILEDMVEVADDPGGEVFAL